MGREIKRVTLDFDWPLNKVWDGFLNPHYVECPTCDGAAQTPARQRLEDLVRLIMLSGEDSRKGKNHPYFVNNFALHHSVTPSPDMLELTQGLAGRAPEIFGHDAIDNWRAVDRIIAAAGLDPKAWGWCPTCKGDGIDPKHAEAYEAWKATEPPTGDGWQVWENVSEGSPISPVFATVEECEDWVVHHENCTPDAAKRFVDGGWAPSMTMGPSGLKAGVQTLEDDD